MLCDWRIGDEGSNEVDVRDLAVVTAYVRSQLRMLDELSDERVSRGEVKWSDPREVRKVVEAESPRMRKAVGEGEGKLEDVQEAAAG